MPMFDLPISQTTTNYERENYICEAFTRLCAARIANGSHDCTNMSERTRSDLFNNACAMADKLETTGVAPWLAMRKKFAVQLGDPS